MTKVDSDKICQVWPHVLHFSVNGNEVFCVNPPEDGHKRRDVPQSITMGLRPGFNDANIHMLDDNASSFALAVVVTQPRCDADLSAGIQRCEEGQAKSRALELFSRLRRSASLADDEIECLTSDTMRLRCPVSMDKIERPVRGRQCGHLQCYSLDAYLTSNRQMRAFNNRWVCPVCSLVLRPTDLCVDGFVERILSQTREDVEEVVVAPDGSWQCVGDPSGKEEARPPSPTKSVDTLDLDGDTTPALLTLQEGGPASSGRAACPPVEDTRGRATNALSLVTVADGGPPTTSGSEVRSRALAMNDVCIRNGARQDNGVPGSSAGTAQCRFTFGLPGSLEGNAATTVSEPINLDSDSDA